MMMSLLAMSSKRTFTIFESEVTRFSMEVTSRLAGCGSALSFGMFSFFLGTGAQPIDYHYKLAAIVETTSIGRHASNPDGRRVQQCKDCSFRLVLAVDFRYLLIIFILRMGSEICSRDNHEAHFSSTFFEYVFEEDSREVRITHDDHIECSSPAIEKNLRDCEERLRKSQKLYKDSSMRTDAVILKALSGQASEVKCSFERPYVFLNDSTAGRGKPYKLVNKLDSKSSQIVVRDEALQYFGVFLCYLADNPRLIADILLTGPNSYGIHCLRMNANGIQRPVYIDDYVLCLDRQPLFAQPVKGQYMWPCLLEKAWLKVNGINKTIHKVDPQEAFRAFLSYPMRTYLMKEGREVVDDDGQNIRLLQNNLYNLQSNKGCIITTKKSPKHKIGISGRRNFYLLKCFNFEGRQLYYLRDPCAKRLDFRGKRSEMGKALIDKLLSLSKDQRIPEGNFVLQEEEMLQQVQSFFIVHYEPNSSFVSQVALTLEEEKETFVEFEMPRDGYVSLCLHQQPVDPQELLFSPLSYLVVSEKDQKIISDLQNSEGCFGIRDTYLLQNLYGQLKAGKYLVRLKKKRNMQKAKAIGRGSDTLVVTAPFSVSFSNDQPALRSRFQDFLRGLGRGKLSESQRQGSKKDFNHISFWAGDLAVVYLRKTAKGKPEIKVEAGFQELKNLKCTSDSLQGGFVVIDHIVDERLVVFEKIDLAEETRLGRYMIQSF